MKEANVDTRRRPAMPKKTFISSSSELHLLIFCLIFGFVELLSVKSFDSFPYLEPNSKHVWLLKLQMRRF